MTETTGLCAASADLIPWPSMHINHPEPDGRMLQGSVAGVARNLEAHPIAFPWYRRSHNIRGPRQSSTPATHEAANLGLNAPPLVAAEPAVRSGDPNVSHAYAR
jgi:hypothetical protein